VLQQRAWGEMLSYIIQIEIEDKNKAMDYYINLATSEPYVKLKMLEVVKED
jgi:hypothetical protein